MRVGFIPRPLFFLTIVILNKLGKSGRVYARKLKIGTFGKKLDCGHAKYVKSLLNGV